MKKSNIIILINSCTKVIDIFAGPFLVAYFLKTSADSMVDLAEFNIYKYAFIGLIGLYAGLSIKKNHPLATYRLGVIIRFIYILSIILFKEDIVNHLNVVAFLFGLTITFYMPYNMFSADAVSNSERSMFEVKKNVTASLISILVPLCLGAMITTTNYQVTAIAILFVSLIQIIASFYLKPLPYNQKPYDLVTSFKHFKNNIQVKKMLIVDFLKGLTISDGALGVLMTILIMNSFKTDMNLGIINSITAILTLVASYLYSKHFKGKSDKKVIILASILPVISVILLCMYTSNVTVIIYNIIFEIFAMGLMGLTTGVRGFNISGAEIKPESKTEYWVIRELALNSGRVFGYILMLVIGLIGIEYLNFLLIALTLSLIILGFFTSSVNKNEEVNE